MQPEAGFALQDEVYSCIPLPGFGLFAHDACGNTAELPPKPHEWHATLDAPTTGKRARGSSDSTGSVGAAHQGLLMPVQRVQRTDACSVHFQPHRIPLGDKFDPEKLAGPVHVTLALHVVGKIFACKLGSVTHRRLVPITGLSLTVEGSPDIPVFPPLAQQQSKAWCRAHASTANADEVEDPELLIRAVSAEGAPDVPLRDELSWHQRLVRARAANTLAVKITTKPSNSSGKREEREVDVQAELQAVGTDDGGGFRMSLSDLSCVRRLRLLLFLLGL